MYFTLILGAVLIYLAIRFNKKRKWLSTHGTRLQGVVIGLAEEEMNGRDLYFPIVKVDDPVLGAREIRLSEGTNMAPRVGSRMELVYHPDDLDHIQQFSTSMTMGHLVLLLVGVVFFLIGLGWITVSMVWDYYLAE